MSQITLPTCSLELWDVANNRPLRFDAKQLILAGYTGRDQESVRLHIEELAQQGVPVPKRVPELFTVNPLSLQVGGTVWANDGSSSGEVEYVLLIEKDDVFFTVGSDHTDRALEALTVEKSKQIYPKVLGREVWRVNQLVKEWDELILRSYVTEGETEHEYQSGTLGGLITAKNLQELIGHVGQPGTVIFSGTVPLIGGQVRYGSRFIGELASPDGRVLTRCSYDISMLGQVR